MVKTNRTKITLALIVLVLIAYISCNTVFAATAIQPAKFSDVKETDWFAPYLNTVVQAGYMSGVPGGKFDPNGVVNWAQLLTVAARMRNDLDGTTIPVSNYDWDHWSHPYISYCAENYIITEEYALMFIEGTNNYDNVADRQFAANVLYKAYRGEGITPLTSIVIPDFDKISLGFQRTAQDFVDSGIMTGVDKANTFNPNGSLTRAQLAAIIARIIDSSLRVGVKTQ